MADGTNLILDLQSVPNSPSISLSLPEMEMRLEEIYTELLFQFPIRCSTTLGDVDCPGIDRLLLCSQLLDFGLCLPRFSGHNPARWLYHAELYFLYHAIYDEKRFSYIYELFDDEAFVWFNSWHRSSDLVTWTTFIDAMLTRFHINALDSHETDFVTAASENEAEHLQSRAVESSVHPNPLIPLIEGSDASIPGDIMGAIDDESNLECMDAPVRELALKFSNTIGDSIASTMAFSIVILGADSILPHVRPSFAMTGLDITVAYDLSIGSKFWVAWFKNTFSFDPGPAMLTENATNRLMHIAQYMFDEMRSRVHVIKPVHPFVFAGNKDFASAKHISNNSDMQIASTIGRFATFLIATGSYFGVNWFGRSFGFDPGPIIVHVSSTEANSLTPCYNHSTPYILDVSYVNTNSQMYVDGYPAFECYCCDPQLLPLKGFSKSRFSDIPGIWLVGSSIPQHRHFSHKFWGRLSTGIWTLQLYLNENGFELHLSDATALIAMYVKIGNIEEAFQLEGVVRFVPICIHLVAMFNHGLGDYTVLIRSIFPGLTTAAAYITILVINDYKHVGAVNNVTKAMKLLGYAVTALIMFKDHSIFEGNFSFIHLAHHALLVMDSYDPSLVNMMEGRGHQTHNQLLQCEVAFSVFVCSAVIIMSIKRTTLSSSRKVFDRFHYLNMGSWSTMLSAYSQHGFLETSLILFFDMHYVDIGPYKLTNLVLLHAIAGIFSLGDEYVWHKWKTKFAYTAMKFSLVIMVSCLNISQVLISTGFICLVHVLVCLSLVSKIGLGCQGAEHHVVNWTTMIDVSLKLKVVLSTCILLEFAQTGYENNALALFVQMEGVESTMKHYGFVWNLIL
ncbi:hypothetical protein SSX86_024639 [Deinandra increscens subsp. villosa]|uniref:Uncharacterized protein n=1 Tax=Deinandra increscens subsp. villosa TaxID=3103831 RepID=A0AAP0GN55_9ASTR